MGAGAQHLEPAPLKSDGHCKGTVHIFHWAMKPTVNPTIDGVRISLVLLGQPTEISSIFPRLLEWLGLFSVRPLHLHNNYDTMNASPGGENGEEI